MAKAKTIKKVTEVSLFLNQEEAETLRDILYRVAGSPNDSRRKHASDILDALKEVLGSTFDTSDIDGAIHFKNY
jgi:hypothetical protein